MLKKIILYALAVIALVVIGVIITVQFRYQRTFEAPYPELRATTDSAMIERGRYLVYGPAHCAVCHAPMSELPNVEKGAMPALQGGYDFQLPIGTLHAPNITPDKETGIGHYTDGEIARALRYGVKRNGQALLDFMPFYDINDEDMVAILSFLRSQAPIRNERPKHSFNLMGKFVMSFIVEPMGDGVVPAPVAPDTTVAYGAYLANSIANCRGCHTLRDMATGAYIGPEMAGGNKFGLMGDDGHESEEEYYFTPNLTPDPATGRLVGWKQNDFLARFRKGRLLPGSQMPWGSFSHITDNDLIAIYKYLQTITPVQNALAAGLRKASEE